VIADGMYFFSFNKVGKLYKVFIMLPWTRLSIKPNDVYEKFKKFNIRNFFEKRFGTPFFPLLEITILFPPERFNAIFLREIANGGRGSFRKPIRLNIRTFEKND